VTGTLENGSVEAGTETAAATVKGATLSAFTTLATSLAAVGTDVYMYPSVFTCANSLSCVEVEEFLGQLDNQSFSVVHQLTGTTWKALARLTGASRTVGASGDAVHEQSLTLTSASCTSTGFC
jgi:hypothetical protein